MAKRARYLDPEAEIDLRKLRYFLAVAERLNFGRAAQELILAQPALSRAIKSLEHDLGVVLFDRDHHTVRLTEAGRVLVAEADGLLARAGAARKRVRAAAVVRPTLTIGFAPGIGGVDVLRRFARENPDVDVEVLGVDDDVDVAWIRTAEESGVDGIETVPLHDDPDLLALPTAHPFTGLAELTLADLAAEPLLCRDSVETTLDAVAVGVGLALVPAAVAATHQRSDITFRPVTDTPRYRVALSVAPEARQRPEVEAFIGVAVHAHQDSGALVG
ncbi:MAG TPA: LysR family transcriptional regulator [Pseudonocardiaceae bacterium]|jgi:DNA-binding transcriptional LysR family regulator